MLQAILIVAYRDIDFLTEIIGCFDPNDYIFFIHINKKSTIYPTELDKLKNIRNVKYVTQKYATYWGSFNHLKAILHLSTECLKYEVDYIHLISGQDYPIKSGDYIKKFLIKNKKKEFITYSEFPCNLFSDDNGGIDRLKYYHFNNYISSNSPYGRRLLKLVFHLQSVFKIQRKWPHYLPKLYGGETWWTLSKECLAYVVNYKNLKPAFYTRFLNTRIPEEIYLQTIIMNSPFKNNVVNSNLRYIEWEWKNGSRPAVLDIEDWDSIQKTDSLFARKFIKPISTTLLKEINKIRSV